MHGDIPELNTWMLAGFRVGECYVMRFLCKNGAGPWLTKIQFYRSLCICFAGCRKAGRADGYALKGDFDGHGVRVTARFGGGVGKHATVDGQVLC